MLSFQSRSADEAAIALPVEPARPAWRSQTDAPILDFALTILERDGNSMSIGKVTALKFSCRVERRVKMI
jgi:hypothetical protein